MQTFTVLGALRRSLAPLLMLAASLNVEAATQFGRTDRGTTASAGMQADYKRASRFTLTENATVRLVCAYLDGGGGGAGSQQFRYVIYRDHDGAPGAKVTETDLGGGLPAGNRGDWQCLGPGLVPLTPGNYWLAIQTSGDAGVLRYFYDGPANWFGNVDAFADGAADAFGAGGAGTGGAISIYADYVTDLHQAGRTSVASVPSSGMTPDFKRASSFTLTETGLLQGASIYLDGLGGATGLEWLQAAVYRDQNGVPGALVMQGGYAPVQSGEPGRWRYLELEPAALTPGKYWLAFQARGTSGVIRYALDGTGNWYGNADYAGDGMTDPFGPANPGNGTISAFAHYHPGTFTTGQFGRTTVGAPLNGLTADYIRGSMFHVDATSERVLNALYAYIDGNGGAAGTQTLRMGLYFYGPDDAGPVPVRTAVSQVVPIVAGRPPGWVRFPMPPVVLSGDYYIVIHSGGTAGVARSYGDGPANWRGNPDNFADGSDETLPATGALGTVTLSVYGAYDEFHPAP